ncbi:LamG-like jellyroll fold domain-containing protein [Flavobacterium urocaniciphilum]|uniref:Por secretion system C-terminal sorting domain-containing protein n=1 Tax=Flavobacterium urocaniciphilum TaxID=1299341 RepID=A0A1H8YV88_9FLAO|nr:LamG-like jellyroll fold domain-containing protein [Flavobacterium urocaniciphilum]SEP55973.1 Por secretion system C-terminal sorting domain-containing protein [Flavobacterium urocaniciphilum]
MKKNYLLSFFSCLFTLLSFSQTTYDFSTDAAIVAGSPWNTQANITIGGVAYTLTSGGNGSFSNVGSGGESNSKCLRKDGSGGDSFTLQRADGQPFQFYGIWVNQQGMNSYSAFYALPPWYTLTANTYTYNDMTPMTPGTAWNNYTFSSAAISPGAGGVYTTSVSINFKAIIYYAIDNIIVGPAIVPNTAPTNMALSASSVNENVAANTTVGTLSSTDSNAGDTFTYTLVSGTGSTDNASFNISGSSLRITNSPDFETKSSYSIRVRTTDQGSLFYEKQFTVSINDINESPSDIGLSATSVNENVAANTTVGSLSSTDVDASNTFTYSLVAGTGSTDNASFNISGSNLRITNSPDFETKSSYSIRVRTTDQGSLTFEKQFTITINNINEGPTDISLSASSLNENVAANTTVGTLSSTDADAGNTFTYSLVAGTGSTDNASFNISGSNLRITNSPDFETKNSYSIRVRSTDQGALTFEKQFTVTINNVNENPTDISLSASAINENVAANSTVGNFSTTDVDAGNTFTYTLVGGTGSIDNASFNISGSGLRITNSPDFETKSSYSIRVRTTDQGGLFFEKQFTITINDLAETPATHLHFDGTNDFVANTTPYTNFTNQISVEFWVYRTGTIATGSGIGQSGATDSMATNVWLMHGNTDNTFSFLVNDAGTWKNSNNSAVIPLNTWTHIAGVADANGVRIYVNGALSNSTTNGISTSILANASAQLQIGKDARFATGSGRNFNGSFDDVRVWNVARTANQINGSKNCELQGTESGLVTYYKFNQGFDQGNNTAITTLTATTGSNGALSNFTSNGTTSNWLAGSAVTTGSIIPSSPVISSPVIYYQGDTASALTATVGANGTGLLWYTVASGGIGSTTAPTPSTATVGNISYWVSSSNANGCESARQEIVVTVNALVPATHLNFDGTNDNVALPATAINNLPQGSIEVWIYPTATTLDNQTICSKQSNSENSYATLTLGGGNAAIGKLHYQSKNGAYILSNATISANQWTHVVVTFTNTQAQIYINGTLDATAVGDFSLPNDTSVTATTIGAWLGDGGGQYFKGNIDEFRVWNAVLTPLDITNTMNCELQGSQTNIVTYYKFNQGNDTVSNAGINSLTDAVGSNTGTLSNFALTGATSNWKMGSTISNGNTCTALSSNDFAIENNIKLYPNPTSNILYIEFNDLSNVVVELIDLNGRVLMNKTLSSTSNSIDLSSYNTAIYLLKVSSNEGASTYKIVKQ